MKIYFSMCKIYFNVSLFIMEHLFYDVRKNNPIFEGF